MKSIIYYGFFLSSLLFTPESKNDFGQFQEATCPIEISPTLKNSNKFVYGYMKVPEFYGKNDSKAIKLAIAIFKCRKDTALYDPLVLNTGGPGLSNIDNFVPAFNGDLGNLILNERDVVIIELRGLKYSIPNLFTPELTNLQLNLLDKHLSIEETINQYTKTIELIYNRFTNEGIQLSAYNYRETAKDVVFVMEQLKYDKFMVFGSSAGTIVAQQLMKDHPERITGAILNAVVDTDVALNDMHLNSIKMLDTIFHQCEKNEKYAKAYPDLKNRFLATLDKLNDKPDTIISKYPITGKDYTIILTGDRVSTWLFNEMYFNVQIPNSLNKIINGDYSEIVERPGILFPIKDFSNGLSWSMILASWPSATEDQLPLHGEYKTFVQGTAQLMFVPAMMNEIRKVWKIDQIEEKNKLIAKNIPTLMLSGQYDHVCPYTYAQNLSKNFDHAYSYVFKGVAHSPVDAGSCGILLIKQFLDNPYKAPNAACVDEYKHEFIIP